MHLYRSSAFYIIIFVAILLLGGCGEDSPVSGNQRVTHTIVSLNISPNELIFDESMGIKDSLVNIQVSGRVERYSDISLNRPAPIFTYTLVRQSDQSLIDTGMVPYNESSAELVGNIDLMVNTTDFNNYRLLIFALSNDQIVSNTAHSTIKIRGFSAGIPEIVFAINPDTVRIPTSGNTPFLVQAKVIHPNGQHLLDRVLVNIRDQNNNLLVGSPFQLFDDGGTESGDPVAGDSVFTRRFQIGPTNNPDVYQLFYFGIDNLGMSTDTIQTQMVISR